MTFVSVLVFCSLGIAGCAALVFAVETLVAFLLHEEETAARPRPAGFAAETPSGEFEDLQQDLAA